MDGTPDDATITAWVHLIRAQQSVVGSLERQLKAAGFPPLEWYDVLLELERAGGALRPFELEGRLLLAQYNLSRLLDRMVQAGLIEKQPCPNDRRGFGLVLTEAGRELRQRLWPFYRQAITDRIGAFLQPGEAELLSELLRKLIDRDPGQCCSPLASGNSETGSPAQAAVPEANIGR